MRVMEEQARGCRVISVGGSKSRERQSGVARPRGRRCSQLVPDF